MKGPASFVLIAVASASLLLNGCSKDKNYVSDTRIVLGTYVKVRIVPNGFKQTEIEKIIEEAYNRIEEYEQTFDHRSRSGELGLFNDSISLSKNENEELFSLLQESLALAGFTNGYFDPTILPIVKLWGFDTDSPKLPDRDAVRTTLENVGYEKVKIYKDRIVKPLSIGFDLSGIAKGKIVDLVRDMLRKRGIQNFLIDAGGDIYVSGKNIHREKWRIAIQHPTQKHRFSGIIEKTDAAVVTSGDYENFFIEDGIRYSHLFNPKTGYPSSDCRSVTIVSEDTVFCDAVVTAIFVMGSKKGYEFLVQNEIDGFIIYGSKEDKLATLSTPGFWE